MEPTGSFPCFRNLATGRIAPFQVWRWISGRVPRASPRLALGYLIAARWALCEPGPLCSLRSLWLNPDGAGSESRTIEMRD